MAVLEMQDLKKLPSFNRELKEAETKYENVFIFCVKTVLLYIFKKLREVAGLKLTFVQEIYWRAVQRRMVMGRLEKFMESVPDNNKYKEKYKYNIPYELAVSLMSGDEAIKKCLIHLCEKKKILVLSHSPDQSALTPHDRLIDGDQIEEPDSGGVEYLSIRDVYNRMEYVEDEHEYLKDKGGFWDLAFLAIKVLRGKKNAVGKMTQENLTNSVEEFFVDEESVDMGDCEDDNDIFFGSESVNDRRPLSFSDESIDGHFLRRSKKKDRKPLHKISHWRNYRPSYWQFINSYIPLRVSNFEYRYVNKDRQVKLNSMWKKSSRWPLFTYWITCVQIAIIIITLIVYGFAPLRYTPYTERALVQLPDLSVQVTAKNVTPNIWAGPDRAALVLLGANYGPCMRKESSIQQIINALEEQEAIYSGCCVRRDSSGCVQVLSSSDCPTEIGLADFIIADNSTELNNMPYSNRTVCGTSPRTCTSPHRNVDRRWMSDRITEWPVCTESVSSTAEHLSCHVTGRPCCIGLQAQCIIASQEQCNFLGGYFHGDAFLCSQVNCLKDVCGLTPFGTSPNQTQRVGLALFLHAGLFHLLMTVIFNLYILRDLEKYLGWLATALLYLGSGIGGNIVSALFVPFSAEVGPAAAMFGVISFFLVFITYHWSFFNRAAVEILKYSALVIALFVIGLLPYVDNYARFGGFLFGILFSFIHVHYIPQHQCVKELRKYLYRNQTETRYPKLGKIILLVFGSIFVILLFAFCILFFYVERNTWEGFSYVNCVIPTSLSNLCLDYRQDIS